MTSVTANGRDQARNYVEPMIKRLSTFFLKSSLLEGFPLRPTDIIINTYPKAGTVLMQQMCYQIAVLSGGASPDDPTGMDYDDIAIAVPWIERRELLGMPERTTTPRILKTHLPVRSFKDGTSKHIVITRDPIHFPSSFLNFLFSSLHPNATDLSDSMKQACVDYLFENFLLKDVLNEGLGTWHVQLKQSLTQTKNVMILFYEDVVENLKETVEKVAGFMGCKLSQQDVVTVVERCDRKYMSTDPKFDAHHEKERFGISSDARHTFDESHVGFKAFHVSNDLIGRLEEMNLRAFGLKTYNELRERIKMEQIKIHSH